jgi:hypothetical protein
MALQQTNFRNALLALGIGTLGSGSYAETGLDSSNETYHNGA